MKRKKEVSINDTYQIRDKKLKETKISYKDFLKSNYWKDFKTKIKKRRFCKGCYSKTNLHLHHKTYYWMFTKNECIGVDFFCCNCHNEIHNISKERKCSVKKATYIHLNNTSLIRKNHPDRIKIVGLKVLNRRKKKKLSTTK